MDKLIDFLVTVEDKRDSWKVKHRLSDIVMLVFFARLAGAEYWEEIEDFGHIYESSLSRVLALDNGIPSHDTIQRVFAVLDAQVLVTLTSMWAAVLEETSLDAKSFSTFSKRLVAIDGKTIRGNASSTQSPLHIVSAFATDLGISFGQVAVSEKSNEITAIPDLVDQLSLAHCMVTIDAMGTQKTIAERIIKQKADYCLAVKENQKGLLEDIVPYFEIDKTAVSDRYQTIEKSHGQIETRTYEVISDTVWFRKEHPDWRHVQSFGKVTSHCQKGETITEDVRYFILSSQVSAEELCSYVRGHWQIESMHWQLDVVFREDANKTLNKQLAFNLNVLDKFCLAVLKKLDTGKKRMSLRRKKYVLSMAFDQYLDNLL